MGEQQKFRQYYIVSDDTLQFAHMIMSLFDNVSCVGSHGGCHGNS